MRFHDCKIAQAGNGKEVLRLLENDSYQLALIDVGMPVMDGVATAHRIHEQFPGVLIIAFSLSEDMYTIEQMYRAGCNGYILKTAGEDEILKAIDTVISGKRYFPPEVIENITLLSEERILKHLKDNFSLSPSEIKIIRLISEDLPNKLIAERFHLSIRTIEKYREQIYKKAGVNTTAGIIQFALRNHIT